METIFIVIYRTSKTGGWKTISDGLFEEKRLAENYIEILKTRDGYKLWEYAIIDGPIVTPESLAEAEAKLGEF